MKSRCILSVMLFLTLCFTAEYWANGIPAEASDWLPGTPADALTYPWVNSVNQELNKPEFRPVFLNDPRSPTVPMIHLFNRAAQAQKDNNLPLAKDFVRQALLVFDRGIEKGYYAEAEIAPIRKAILVHVPQELGGESREKTSPKALSLPSSTLSEKEQLARLGHTPLGVPEPGTTMDVELTTKHRNPQSEHTADRNAQINLGGARYFVSGQLLKIDGEHYTIMSGTMTQATRSGSW